MKNGGSFHSVLYFYRRVCVHILYTQLYAHTHTYIYICVCVCVSCGVSLFHVMFDCLCVCVYVCIYVDVDVHIYMSAHFFELSLYLQPRPKKYHVHRISFVLRVFALQGGVTRFQAAQRGKNKKCVPARQGGVNCLAMDKFHIYICL